MTLTKLSIRPGITKLDTDYSQEGRWIDGDKVRFIGAYPQKIGGWEKFIETGFTGKCRGIKSWRDSTEFRRAAMGTHRKLYVLGGGELTDITPHKTVNTGTLVDKFSTSSGSSVVTVNHASHGQQADDQVVFWDLVTVGGVTIFGPYVIQSVVDANNYTIQVDDAATSTVAAGGGTVNYRTFRGALSNPFSTTSGSTTVSVAHADHGRGQGDYVEFDGATAVGGITIDGTYQVVSVPDGDNYTITHASAASSTAGPGGGTGVTYRYEIAVGLEDTTIASGYGTGSYGTGTYGTPSEVGITLLARAWSLDNLGDVLIANPRGGDIYEWMPTRGGRATLLPNAPTGCNAMFVTEEGAIVALGGNGNKLNIEWCDDEDRYLWEAAETNTAGSKVANVGSEIMCGRAMRGNMAIILTDAGALLFQYTGDDFVYSVRKIGSSCGAIGPQASAEYSGRVFWWSQSGFFASTGGEPAQLPADDVFEFVSRNSNTEQQTKFFVAINADFNEVWFFYCGTGSTEINRYVAFSITGQTWIVGTLARTAWIDKEIFPTPLAAGADGYIYAHETGVDSDGAAMDSYITSAPIDLGDGDQNMSIERMIPDFKNLVGTVDVTVYTKDYPNDSAVTNGPYTFGTATGIVDPRIDGRQAAFKIEQASQIGGDWRLGAFRIGVEPNGSR